MNRDPAKVSLSSFLAGEGRVPLQAPPSFSAWMQAGAWAVELYEPELLAGADARTSTRYDGKSQRVINLCSYNYLGLANHPDVVAAAREAPNTHGLGACRSPMLSGMTDLHRDLESRIAESHGREDAMLVNSGFGGPRRAHLRHLFKGVGRAWRICRRIEGDAPIPAVLRAPLCLFVRVAAGCHRWSPQSVGDCDPRRSGIEKGPLGECRLFSRKTARARHRHWSIDNLRHADRHRRSGTNVSALSRVAAPRTLGRTGRLPSRPPKSNLFPCLRHRQTHPGGP